METSLNRHCCNLLSEKTAEEQAAITLAVSRTDRPESLQELAAWVLETWGDSVEAVILFGSFARGRQTASSDIDILTVLDRSVPLDRDVYSRWRPRKFQGHEVAPLIVQIPGKGERIGGLWFEVALDGIVLFDRNLRLSRFLSHVRDLVATGKVRRMATHGHPYWVHCENAGDRPPEAAS